MKALLLLIFLISFFFSKSQNTTEEEYNWMNKGYKVMITSGLDMKRGYFFDEDLFYKNI
jgi:hypothetical protein